MYAGGSDFGHLLGLIVHGLSKGLYIYLQLDCYTESQENGLKALISAQRPVSSPPAVLSPDDFWTLTSFLHSRLPPSTTHKLSKPRNAIFPYAPMPQGKMQTQSKSRGPRTRVPESLKKTPYLYALRTATQGQHFAILSASGVRIPHLPLPAPST